MLNLSPIGVKDLPKSPKFSKLIGPSFILLGLGLGSGELILWPYLVSNYGLGIIWGAILGITLQFFINMEIERYTLINGESIFVGFTRKFGLFSPIFFILSTFIPWIWPGIIASSSILLSNVFSVNSTLLAVILLLLIGIIYSTGGVIYKTQERLQKIIIFLGIPFILFLLSIFFLDTPDLIALSKGLFGIGEGYIFLPTGISISILVGALAFSGAGGNLNLAQSYYIKEKGYGMGKYLGKITSLFSKSNNNLQLEGYTFPDNQENIDTFKSWWMKINIEHALVFWGTGLFTILLLATLAYSTVYGASGVEKGIKFILIESKYISQIAGSILGTFFIIFCSIMLFGTQFSVTGSTSRIMSENLVILNPKIFKINNLS